MDNRILLGIFIILISYAAIWFLLFKSIKIVDFIDKNNLNKLEDIQKEMKLLSGDQ